MNKPVLFLVFNRLDTTRKVFEQIRAARPPRIYVASDGARASVEGEKETVESVRKWVLDNIDWPCEVRTLFREKNLGCGKAVSGAITWFFSQEESGIILEDDCLPSKSFFAYCEELLDYYKDDKRIWHITGDQFFENYNSEASYYFAKIMHCWGWASWADRWEHFEYNLDKFKKEDVQKFSDGRTVQKYWSKILRQMQNHEIDTWDYQWTFAIIKNNGFCINPSLNLISNIGIDGTHFSNTENNYLLNLPIYEFEKIIHPEKMELDEEAIDWIYEKVFYIEKPSFKSFLKYIKKYPFFFFRKDFWHNLLKGEI